jgi:hypothetical protein
MEPSVLYKPASIVKFYLTSFNAYSVDGKVLDMGWTFPWEFEEVTLDEDGSIATPFLD